LLCLAALAFFSFLALNCGKSSSSSSNSLVDDDDNDASPADDDDNDNDDTSPVNAIPTTLDVTFGPKETAPGSGQYVLAQFPGEPYMARNDLNIKPTLSPAAGAKPLSMTYFSVFSDLHITDEEAPARLTFFDGNVILDGLFQAAFRPQMDLGGQMLNELVRTADRIQSDYGRDFDFMLLLGDVGDNAQTNEMKTAIDIFDATGLLTGDPGWVRVDSGDLDIDPQTGHDRGERNFDIEETNLEGKNIDPFNRPGYPNSNADFQTPGLVRASGEHVPWFATIGNHDEENCGVFEMSTLLTIYKPDDYVGEWAPFGMLPAFANMIKYWEDNPTADIKIGNGLLGLMDWRDVFEIMKDIGMIPPGYTEDINPALEPDAEFARILKSSAPNGVHVAPDPDRAYLGRAGEINLLEPMGHGFKNRPAQDFGYYRLDWSQIDPSSDLPLRILTLDSTEEENIADGGISDTQLAWFESELDQAATDEVLVMATSHFHLSSISKNGAELAALLASYPNFFIFLEGHGHDNLVAPRPGTGDSPGYWEVETPSDMDFPQQARIFEIVDNRDGTGIVYTTLYDHWSTVGDDADVLGDLGRQLAFTDWMAKGWDGKTPFAGMGQLSDRNVALTFAIPAAIEAKLAQIPSNGSITSVDSLGHLYHP